MINEQTNHSALADILESYAIETGAENERERLQKWIEKYPEFAEDLMNFHAERSFSQFRTPEISASEEAGFLLRSRATLEKFRAERRGQAEKPLASLTAQAQALGMNKTRFASALKMSLSLVMYLEKRRLRFATVPRQIIQRLAATLQTSEQAVANYLDAAPDFAANASFKAVERPTEIEQKDFAQAVREDQSLTAAEKAELLSFIANRIGLNL